MVCALYIPEVRFGNVTTMEPIVLQLVPQDRFSKTCFICEQQRHESKASIGACMQCNKSGCKQYFHVTCAQAAGLLCEEAGNYMDNVKYCGYCPYHYQKLKRDSNIKIIPAFKPIPADCDSREASPERKPAPGARARLKGGATQERRTSRQVTTNGVSSDGGASSDGTEPRNGASDGCGSSSSPSTTATTTTTPLPVSGRGASGLPSQLQQSCVKLARQGRVNAGRAIALNNRLQNVAWSKRRGRAIWSYVKLTNLQCRYLYVKLNLDKTEIKAQV